MSLISFTSDGRRVAFLEWANHSQGTIHVGKLHGGGTWVSNLRHFTLSDSTDSPSDWTSDGKSLIFQSNRTGHDGIYRQALDEDSPELLVADARLQGQPAVSPDGKWLLYFQGPPLNTSSLPSQLMKVPIGGGPAQALFALPQEHGRLSCTRFPPGTCVVFVRSDDRKDVIVSAFDPVKGPSGELTRIPLDPGINVWDAALSGDGTHIALVLGSLARIQIVSLRGETASEFQVKGTSWIMNARWASDGKALFVSAEISGRAVLLRVDLDGRAQPVIEKFQSDVTLGIPSPDGRNLAITTVAQNKNMWMMENF
jgi:Tol biopolymer transport system component